jgi:peptidyl-prolyl cis-trans isomerase C
MTTFRTLCGGVALTALTFGTALAQEAAAPAPTPAEVVTPTADTVVATVNGVEITLGQMIVMKARLPDQYQAMPAQMLFQPILDQLIQQVALAALHEGELSRGAQLALENERLSYTASEAINDLTENAVTEEAIQAAYDEQIAGTEPAKEWNAAHILLESEEDALSVKAEIEGGADFATVAENRSTGPSGPNGGALGWFGAGMMVPEFETAVASLEPGQVSDPVQTQFGWHVILLNEVRDTTPPTLDEVRGEITVALRRAAAETVVADAVAGADVVTMTEGLDPASISNFDLVVD